MAAPVESLVPGSGTSSSAPCACSSFPRSDGCLRLLLPCSCLLPQAIREQRPREPHGERHNHARGHNSPPLIGQPISRLCPAASLRQMMPPKEIAEKMVHPEAPPTHPCGPNTSFQFLTPMPFRFQEAALPAHNAHHAKARKEHPIYETSASVIGKMAMQATDYPMRWWAFRPNPRRSPRSPTPGPQPGPCPCWLRGGH